MPTPYRVPTETNEPTARIDSNLRAIWRHAKVRRQLMVQRFYLLWCITVVIALTNSGTALATFVAYRVGDDYIIVGADSRALLPSNEIMDRSCKIRVLDKTHLFSGEGIFSLTNHPSMPEVAKGVFDENPTATVKQLVKIWLSYEKLILISEFRNHPEDTLPKGLAAVEGFFGQVRASDSAWAMGKLRARDDKKTDWQEDAILEGGPRNQFFSASEDRGLIRQFFEENHPPAGDVETDAAAMQRMVEYVIERAGKPLVGGVPVVAVLEYGKPARWFAGGAVCGDQQK
jgi:hypothetical protein